jgi:hypothetical protein
MMEVVLLPLAGAEIITITIIIRVLVFTLVPNPQLAVVQIITGIRVLANVFTRVVVIVLNLLEVVG